jgi:CheY-like chemotaxis protein
MSRVVLYIDDSQDSLLVVQRILAKRRPDVQLRTASTGADGVAAAASDPPDLILLDNRLPDATGMQVLHQLAAIPATAAIPVIILSGDSGRVTARELLAAGAAEFMIKPFDMNQLLAVVRRYLP